MQTQPTEKLPPIVREKCGTYAGYNAHNKAKERVCQPCKDAAKVYMSEWAAKNKEHVKTYNKEHGKKYYEQNRDRLIAQSLKYQQEHAAERKIYMAEYWVKNKETLQAQKKAYYEENKEALYQKHREWVADNPDKMEEYRKKWEFENPEKAKQAKKDWADRNIEYMNAKSRARRAMRIGNGFEPYTVDEMLEKYGTDCHVCGEPIDLEAPRKCGRGGWEKGLHIDHLIPIAKGGSDTLENTRPAHGLCNISRGASMPEVEDGIRKAAEESRQSDEGIPCW